MLPLRLVLHNTAGHAVHAEHHSQHPIPWGRLNPLGDCTPCSDTQTSRGQSSQVACSCCASAKLSPVYCQALQTADSKALHRRLKAPAYSQTAVQSLSEKGYSRGARSCPAIGQTAHCDQTLRRASARNAHHSQEP